MRLVLPGVPGSLVFVGREPAEALLDAPGVVLTVCVDVAEQRRLRLCSCGESGCGPVDQLNFDGRPQVLRQGIVEAVTDAAGRWGDAGVEQALGEPD